MVNNILRIEGLVLLTAALVGYWIVELNRWWFLLISAPDVSIAGYLVNPRLGQI